MWDQERRTNWAKNSMFSSVNWIQRSPGVIWKQSCWLLPEAGDAHLWLHSGHLSIDHTSNQSGCSLSACHFLSCAHLLRTFPLLLCPFSLHSLLHPPQPVRLVYCPYCSKCLWIHYRKQMDTGTTSFSHWQSQTGKLLWGLFHSISSCLCRSSILRDSISTCTTPSLSLKNVHTYALLRFLILEQIWHHWHVKGVNHPG